MAKAKEDASATKESKRDAQHESRRNIQQESRRDTQQESRRDTQQESRKGQPQTSMQTRRGYESQQQHSPFALMRRFNEEMDRLFQDFGFGRAFPGSSPGREMSMFGEQAPSIWSPQVEMFEREGELVVQADLPGMKADDIEVDIADNAVVIRGERRSEHDEEEEGYYRTERSYGSFFRAIPLPEGVDTQNAQANFSDGVLEITMSAPERTGRRRLEIKGREEERPRARSTAAGQR